MPKPRAPSRKPSPDPKPQPARQPRQWELGPVARLEKARTDAERAKALYKIKTEAAVAKAKATERKSGKGGQAFDDALAGALAKARAKHAQKAKAAKLKRARYSPSSRTPSPPRDTRNLRFVDGRVTISVFEGEKVLDLSPLASTRFVRLCATEARGAGVRPGYVTGHFRRKKHPKDDGLEDPATEFALVASKTVDGAELVVGYAQCSLFSSIKKVTPARLVKLNLICTQGPAHYRLKGAGTLLLNELERYSREELGATTVVLDSVDDPNTWQTYAKRGYVRSWNACGTRRPEDVAAVQQAFRKFAPTLLPLHADYVTAMRGEYLQGLNVPVDTVFMSKCLGGPATNRRGVLWNPAASPALTVPAKFPTSSIRVLAVYGPGNPMPRIGNGGGAVPDVLAAVRREKRRLSPGTPDGFDGPRVLRPRTTVRREVPQKRRGAR